MEQLRQVIGLRSYGQKDPLDEFKKEAFKLFEGLLNKIKITNIDRREHKLTLSIKAHEINEEKRAMADYGSSDSGASLGDILGAAIRKASEDEVTSEPEVDQSNELKKSDTENLEQEEDKSDKNSENEEQETSELASADSEEDSKNKK